MFLSEWNGIEILFIMPLIGNVFIESWIVENMGKSRYFELKMNTNNRKKFIFISPKWQHTWPSQLIINMNILTWNGILKHIADGFSLTLMNFSDEFVDRDKTIIWNWTVSNDCRHWHSVHYLRKSLSDWPDWCPLGIYSLYSCLHIYDLCLWFSHQTAFNFFRSGLKFSFVCARAIKTMSYNAHTHTRKRNTYSFKSLSVFTIRKKRLWKIYQRDFGVDIHNINIMWMCNSSTNAMKADRNGSQEIGIPISILLACKRNVIHRLLNRISFITVVNK